MKSRALLNLFQMASLVMVLIAVALLSAITTMHFAIHGAEVQVPALKGMTVAEARSQAAGMGLTLDVDNRYYSGDVAAGHILSQSPAQGTVVRREWRVRVAESLGPQKVDVPDAVGSDQRLAALQLRRVGLDVGTTAHLPWAASAEGAVIAQDPPAHAQGIARPSVNLLVAAPEDDDCGWIRDARSHRRADRGGTIGTRRCRHQDRDADFYQRADSRAEHRRSAACVTHPARLGRQPAADRRGARRSDDRSPTHCRQVGGSKCSPAASNELDDSEFPRTSTDQLRRSPRPAIIRTHGARCVIAISGSFSAGRAFR